MDTAISSAMNDSSGSRAVQRHQFPNIGVEKSTRSESVSCPSSQSSPNYFRTDGIIRRRHESIERSRCSGVSAHGPGGESRLGESEGRPPRMISLHMRYRQNIPCNQSCCMFRFRDPTRCQKTLTRSVGITERIHRSQPVADTRSKNPRLPLASGEGPYGVLISDKESKLPGSLRRERNFPFRIYPKWDSLSSSKNPCGRRLYLNPKQEKTKF